MDPQSPSDKLMNFYRHHKAMVIISILLLLVGLIWLSFNAYQSRAGKEFVTVSLTPKDATITGDIALKNAGKHYIAPGVYSITVSRDGFANSEQRVEIVKGRENIIVALLRPESDEAKQWAKDNQNEYLKAEADGARAAQLEGDLHRERSPIVKELPIRDPYFTIGYKAKDDNDITVTIRGTSPRYRQAAIEHLRSRGFEPADYDIEYVNYNNPLTEDAS